jgi:hypothetical protein
MVFVQAQGEVFLMVFELPLRTLNHILMAFALTPYKVQGNI